MAHMVRRWTRTLNPLGLCQTPNYSNECEESGLGGRTVCCFAQKGRIYFTPTEANVRFATGARSTPESNCEAGIARRLKSEIFQDGFRLQSLKGINCRESRTGNKSKCDTVRESLHPLASRRNVLNSCLAACSFQLVQANIGIGVFTHEVRRHLVAVGSRGVSRRESVKLASCEKQHHFPPRHRNLRQITHPKSCPFFRI